MRKERKGAISCRFWYHFATHKTNNTDICVFKLSQIKIQPAVGSVETILSMLSAKSSDVRVAIVDERSHSLGILGCPSRNLRVNGRVCGGIEVAVLVRSIPSLKISEWNSQPEYV